MDGFTIGRLAAATHTKAETIRYYERIGLLAPVARTEGNYRLYDRAALDRLHFVRRARSLGFSLEQTRDLLDLAREDRRSCGEVDKVAREHLSRMDHKIADLVALREELAALIDRCGRTVIADCRVIAALAPGRSPARPAAEPPGEAS